MKSEDANIRFLFLTGVSKFSKVSIFSDLNHLDDLTLDENYATLTGYTQSELEFYFEDYIQSVMERHQLTRPVLLEMMRENYNGFSWDGTHTVYNPFGTLNFFKKRSFEGFWFASGTPTFLVNLTHAFQINDLEQVKRIINTLFSDLPSNLYERDDNDKFKEMQLSERFFHGTIHLIFKYLGLHIDSEVWSSQGRADSVVQTATHVYVFEFKYNRSGKAAMTQLLKNNYADKYRADGKTIIGIGVNFSHKTRKLNGWEVKKLQ